MKKQEQLDKSPVARRYGMSMRARVIALCLASVAISGCARKHFEWTEQVQLADGATVDVERSIRYGKVLRELGGPTSAWISEANVTIVDRGERLATWSHAMEPFIVDRDKSTGKWLLVANAMDYCEYAANFASPAPTFLAFELDGGSWKYIGLPEAAVGRNANMLLGVPGKGDGQYLDAQQIQASNAGRLPSQRWRTVSKDQLNLCAADMVRKQKAR
jgi:hypothetical protein